MTKGELAKQNFLGGLNCSQAVLCAFCDQTGLDGQSAAQLSSAFGAGIGGQREVCGALSGMLMAFGLIRGGYRCGDTAEKAAYYAQVRELCDRFRAENGSIICREILGLDKNAVYAGPSERTPEYYKKRPCPDKAASAAQILSDYLAQTQEK